MVKDVESKDQYVIEIENKYITSDAAYQGTRVYQGANHTRYTLLCNVCSGRL